MKAFIKLGNNFDSGKIDINKVYDLVEKNNHVFQDVIPREEVLLVGEEFCLVVKKHKDSIIVENIIGAGNIL